MGIFYCKIHPGAILKLYGSVESPICWNAYRHANLRLSDMFCHICLSIFFILRVFFAVLCSGASRSFQVFDRFGKYGGARLFKKVCAILATHTYFDQKSFLFGLRPWYFRFCIKKEMRLESENRLKTDLTYFWWKGEISSEAWHRTSYNNSRESI